MNNQDKRLHNLDQEKLERLTHLANTLASTPDSQKMNVFLQFFQLFLLELTSSLFVVIFDNFTD